MVGKTRHLILTLDGSMNSCRETFREGQARVFKGAPAPLEEQAGCVEHWNCQGVEYQLSLGEPWQAQRNSVAGLQGS